MVRACPSVADVRARARCYSTPGLISRLDLEIAAPRGARHYLHAARAGLGRHGSGTHLRVCQLRHSRPRRRPAQRDAAAFAKERFSATLRQATFERSTLETGYRGVRALVRAGTAGRARPPAPRQLVLHRPVAEEAAERKPRAGRACSHSIELLRLRGRLLDTVRSRTCVRRRERRYVARVAAELDPDQVDERVLVAYPRACAPGPSPASHLGHLELEQIDVALPCPAGRGCSTPRRRLLDRDLVSQRREVR